MKLLLCLLGWAKDWFVVLCFPWSRFVCFWHDPGMVARSGLKIARCRKAKVQHGGPYVAEWGGSGEEGAAWNSRDRSQAVASAENMGIEFGCHC